MAKRLIVISAPSGGGKSVVARYILNHFVGSRFSISATTRAMRPREVNGKDYYFLTKEDFKNKITAGEFVEHEEIFGNYYGTLKSEIETALRNNEILLFDVDVKGALSLRKAFPDDSLLIFLAPPDLKTLEDRLRLRGTESEEQINTRLSRSEMEIAQKDLFDEVVVNLILENTFADIEEIIRKNI